MSTDTREAQEPLTERGTIMLSATEKRALRLVAASMDSTESDVLRQYHPPEIVAEAEKAREKLGLPSINGGSR